MSSRVLVINSGLYTRGYFQNEDICRLCWSTNAHKAIIVSLTVNGKNTKNLLAEKIEDCLNLDLSKEGAPKKVCSKCCDIVESFYDFKRFCCEADRKLNEILDLNVSKTPGDLPENSLDVGLGKNYNHSETAFSDGHGEDSLQDFLNLALPKVESHKIRKGMSKSTCKAKRKHNFSSTDSSNSYIDDGFQKFQNLTPLGGQEKTIVKMDVKEDNSTSEEIYSCIEASESNIQDTLQKYFTSAPLKNDKNNIIKENCSLALIPDTETSDSNIQENLQEHLHVVPLRGDHLQDIRKQTREDNSVLENKYSDSNIEDCSTNNILALKRKKKNIEDSLENCVSKTPMKQDQTKNKTKYPKRGPTFCNICRNDLKTVDKFIKHNSEYHGIETNGDYKCFGCHKRFKNNKNRLGHEINFCKGLKNGYKCDVCGRYLPKRRTYEMHMKAHRSNKPVNLPGELFKCRKCCRLFTTREKLTEHKKSHEIKENFVCEACGRCFSRRDYLNKHKLTHEGLRQHACPHCDYKAIQKTSLLVHLRKHTGERPFSCDLCPQRCVSSSNLRAHRQRHLGVKQFQCTICSKKFGYKQSLEEHIATTHERAVQSHTCPHCGVTYSRGRGLRRHIEAKHGKSKDKPLSKTDGASGEELILIVNDKYEVKQLVSKDQNGEFIV